MYRSALPSGTDILIKTFAPVETNGKQNNLMTRAGLLKQQNTASVIISRASKTVVKNLITSCTWLYTHIVRFRRWKQCFTLIQETACIDPLPAPFDPDSFCSDERKQSLLGTNSSRKRGSMKGGLALPKQGLLTHTVNVIFARVWVTDFVNQI